MSHIFSFIHCSSTQIMCQVCFEIQSCNAKLLKIHYNIIASFKKENAHSHPSPSNRGQERFSMNSLGECGSQGSLGVAFLGNIMQCCYEI